MEARSIKAVQKSQTNASPVKGSLYRNIVEEPVAISKESVKIFFTQWYEFSKIVPGLLARHASDTRIEEERVNIVKNLHSELGLDGIGISHAKLLSDLILKATGSEPRECDVSEITHAFINNLWVAAVDEVPSFNSGVLCGLEHVAYDILSVLGEILTKSGNESLLNHPYIAIHEKLEAEHIHNTEENNRLYVEESAQVNHGFSYAMNAWERFWDGAYVQMQAHKC